MIAENLNTLSARIKEKCLEIGRNPDEVTLIAVSKNHSVEAVREAMATGHKDFGENRPQELRDKHNEIGDEVTWHMIGTLQKNKVKYAVRAAEFIHSVDSLSLAKEIQKRAAREEKIQNVMLEVKTSEEDSKAGFTGLEGIYETAAFCHEAANIKLTGLMTIAPFTDDTELVRNSFRSLRELKEAMNGKGYGLTHLSMGMTADFEIAIEEGATMLRIGTAIFGERNYG